MYTMLPIIISCIVAAPEAALAPFGFSGLEIFRASSESVGLSALDLNGDGLADLVYADNADATVRLLFQVKPGERPKAAAAAPAAQASGVKKSVNAIESDERFRVERFYTEKKVFALAAADFDGDALPDLAYYGDPKELEVVFQRGEWGSRREAFSITDGAESADGLAAADLDRDGKTDLILLGAGKTYILRQRSEGGGLRKPQAIYNAYNDVTALRAGDLDGDQRTDLVYLRPRASHPFLVRLQREGGFGPEIPVKSLPVHDAFLESLDGSSRADILAIQGNTRRIRALRWGKPKEPPQPALSEPRLYAFRPEGDAALRRIHLGDVNGDGRADLVASSAETAELDIYLQDARGELSAPSPSPTLAEVKSVATGDLDGDSKPEVIVASAREKAIGVSRWVPAEGGGRLSIPESYTIEGEPLLVAAGRLEEKGTQILVVYKSAGGKFHLAGRALSREGGFAPLGEMAFEAGAEPNALVLFDAQGDGLTDALVFVPYDDPRLFVREVPSGGGEPGFKFQEASRGKDFGIGQISKLTPAAFSLCDMEPEGRTMLVAQKSFARALVLEPAGKLKVIEQIAGRGAAAEISGAAALDLDGDPELEVLLFDRAQSAVDVLDRTPQGVYRPARSISMPGFEFLGFHVLDLNGDGLKDAALLGKHALSVLYRGGEDGELEEVGRYDLEDKALGEGNERGRPDLVLVGDLNADGARDVVFSTDPRGLLGFLVDGGTPGGPLRLQCVFPIFEEKSFMRRAPNQGPREMLARDLTGDGKTDIVLLIHDRILLYPQE